MATVPTLTGITSQMVDTTRIQMHVLTSGPDEGIPVVFVHGNFSSSTYWEETMLMMPETFRCIAPDMRGYGDTEDKLIDATRGARDWSDDLKALSDTMGDKPAHIIGWSIGAAIVMQFAMDYPDLVSTLTLLSPVSPYGFGGTKDEDGKPCFPDYAGSGGGVVNPEFIQRIKDGDRSTENPNSPRNVITTYYFKPPFKAAREEDFLTAAMLEKIGEQKYPGDLVPSANWPNVAPGKFGPINATSPGNFDTSELANMEKKIPILWVRGDADQIVSDNSMFDLGALGKLGFVPGWPGDDIYPPQPMVTQMRYVLDLYKANGGSYEEYVLGDAGHGCHIEKPEEFAKVFIKHIS